MEPLQRALEEEGRKRRGRKRERREKGSTEEKGGGEGGGGEEGRGENNLCCPCRWQQSISAHIIIVTADHFSKGDLVAQAIGRLVGVQGLAVQVRHGQVGWVRQHGILLLRRPTARNM